MLNRSAMNLYQDASNYFHRARTILEVIPNADAEVNFLKFNMNFIFQMNFYYFKFSTENWSNWIFNEYFSEI